MAWQDDDKGMAPRIYGALWLRFNPLELWWWLAGRAPKGIDVNPKTIIDALMNMFKHLFIGLIKSVSGGTPDDTAELAGEILGEAGQAALMLVAGGGIINVGAFLLELKSIHDQAQESGASGDLKYQAFSSAARIAWQRFGGAGNAPALQTIIDIFSAWFHASVKLEEQSAK